MTERICASCSRPITKASRTGLCQRCASSAFCKDPATSAKRSAGTKRAWMDPAYRAAVTAKITEICRSERMRELRRELSLRNDTIGKMRAYLAAHPEVEARRARRSADTRRAWCPSHLRATDDQLAKARFSLAERKLWVEEQLELERQEVRRKFEK